MTTYQIHPDYDGGCPGEAVPPAREPLCNFCGVAKILPHECKPSDLHIEERRRQDWDEASWGETVEDDES